MRRGLLSFAIALLVSFAMAQEIPEIVRAGLETAFRDLEGGRVDEAISRYEALAAEHSGVTEIHLQLGAAYYRAARLDEALESWKKGLAIDPDHAGLLRNATAAASRLDQNEVAAEFARRGLALSADDLNMLAAAATAFQRAGALDEAATTLAHLADLQSGSAAIWYNLGTVQLRRNELEDAVLAFRKALDLDPQRHRAAYNLGAALERLGRDAEAIEVFEEILRPIRKDIKKGRPVAAEHAVGLSQLAGLLEASGQIEDAAAAWEDATKADPGQARYALGLGLLSARGADHRRADLFLSKALDLDPALLGTVVVPLAQARLSQGASKPALELLAQGLSRLEGAERDAARNLMVDAMRETGDRDGAVAMLRELIAEAPKDVAMVGDLANLLDELGEPAQAADVLLAGWRASSDVGIAFSLAGRLDASQERGLLLEVIEGSQDTSGVAWARARSTQLALEAEDLEGARALLVDLDLEQLDHATAAGLAATRAAFLVADGELADALAGLTSFAGSPSVDAMIASLRGLSGEQESAITELRAVIAQGAAVDGWSRAALGNLQALLWVSGEDEALRQSLASHGAVGRGLALASGGGSSGDVEDLTSDDPLTIEGGELALATGGRVGEAMDQALERLQDELSLRAVTAELADFQRRRPGSLLDGSSASSMRQRLPRSEGSEVALVRATIDLLNGQNHPDAFSSLTLQGELAAIATVNEAVAWVRRGDIDKAIGQLRGAGSAIASYNLGVLLDYNGDRQGALQAYRSSLGADGVPGDELRARIGELER